MMLPQTGKILAAAAVASCLASAPPRPVGQPRQETPATARSADSHLARRMLALGDADARVREGARRDLLATTVSDLPALRDAVAELAGRRQLSSEIVRVVYDAIGHVHLREAKARFLDQQPPAERSGDVFLGIMLGGDLTGNAGSPSGVPIRTTIPGFIAYEAFEDGDLLVAVRSERGMDRLSHFGDLRSAISGLSPGDSVEFLVARGGEIVHVSLRLDERIEPYTSISQRWDIAAAEARRAAEAYWDEQIVPLLPTPATPVARSG